MESTVVAPAAKIDLFKKDRPMFAIQIVPTLMVGGTFTAVTRNCMIAQFAQDAVPLLEKLDPTRRVATVMALLALVLLGLLLVACTMIGARWVRQMSISQPIEREQRRTEKETVRRKLADGLPDVESKETLIVDRGTDETMIDQ